MSGEWRQWLSLSLKVAHTYTQRHTHKLSFSLTLSHTHALSEGEEEELQMEEIFSGPSWKATDRKRKIGPKFFFLRQKK